MTARARVLPTGGPVLGRVDGRGAAVPRRGPAEELPFRDADRPWERAAFVVAGVGLADQDDLLVAEPGR